MNGKQAKALRALLKEDVKKVGWTNGYRDVNIKEKPILDAWGKLVGTYTTSTKVLEQSYRTHYKFLKKLYLKKEGK